jgi:hypothetical protein
MINCPEDYYDNCANALKKCMFCCAGEGTTVSKLHYIPKLKDECLANHPEQDKITQRKKEAHKQKVQKKLQKASPSKRGYQQETKIVKQLNDKVNKRIDVIKKTVASGRIYHDGDHSLLDGLIRSDSKLRLTSESFTVSKEEYQKGLTQGINQWIIANPLGTVYVLTEELYCELLAQIHYGRNISENS